jgi:Mg-chelatase subunit ChlD
MSRRGRTIRAVPPEVLPNSADIAIDATLRQAALRIHTNKTEKFVLKQDVRIKMRCHPVNSLVIFLLDASESMIEEHRMESAKGAILGLLNRTYQKRQKIALVTFQDEEAKILLLPTKSPALAGKILNELPNSGATPLAEGLAKSLQLIRNEKIKDPGLEIILLVISDGEANVALNKELAIKDELKVISHHIRLENVHSIVLDLHSLHSTSILMRELAGHLQANYHHVQRLQTGEIIRFVLDADQKSFISKG